MYSLSSVALFSALSEEQLEPLNRRCTKRTVRKNSIVLHEGDPALSLYVITSGHVKVFLSDEEGREIVLNTLGPGQYFGELALLDEEERSASVMCTETSTFLTLSKEDFLAALEEHAQLGYFLIKALARRVRSLSENVRGLALKPVYNRVASLLEGLSVEQGSTRIIPEKLTQQEIADRVGASREMVARIMKDLTTGGFVSLESRHIVLHKALPTRY